MDTLINKKNSPFVSIVMPTFNQVAFIQDSIRSVLSQGYEYLELIVMDGGSTDGTIDVLNELSLSDERLKWRSGQDSGPADAVNKAFLMCRGSIIGWLNSDDLYTPGAIERAVIGLDAHPDWIMLYGHGQHVNLQGQFLDEYPTKNPARCALEDFHHGCFICQPTVFFKPALLTLAGKLDVKLKTAFDFDYWLRVFSLFPERVGFVDDVQAYSRMHADSITLSQRRLVFVESMSLISKYIGDPLAHWLITYAKEVYEKDDSKLLDIKSDLYQIIQAIDPQPSAIGIKALRLAVEQFSPG